MKGRTDLGRTPPHSLEAEEYLLSCCLLDGGETLARCLDAGLAVQAFYIQANQVIYGKLCDLRRLGLPAAIEPLIEELKASRQLEAVGGVPYLMQVSGRIPTTARAGYFIDTVREHYLRRELVREAQRVVEGAYRGDTPAHSLLERFDALRGNAAFAVGSLGERLDAARLRSDMEPPELREVFKLNQIPIATPGNVVGICAQAKAGKTAFVGAMLAAAMATDGDFLGAVSSNPEGRAVVHLDTEQSPRDHWLVIQTALRRAGLKVAPSWLISYRLAGWPISERRLALEHVLKLAKREFGGVHSVFLDGVADFVMDPNDGGEAFPFVDRLQALAVQFDCPLVAVLHLNPGSMEKSRGHLGSQLERKAETNLLLEKDAATGRTVVFSTKQRRAPILRADGPCFRWDEAEQMHVSVETVRAKRDAATEERARELAGEIFAGRGGMRYGEVVLAVKNALKCSEPTADRRFGEMKKHGIIVRSPPNLWTLAA